MAEYLCWLHNRKQVLILRAIFFTSGKFLLGQFTTDFTKFHTDRFSSPKVNVSYHGKVGYY